MRRTFLTVLLMLGVLGPVSPRTGAFSLIGNLPAWFTDNAGMFPGSDIYGPVNLGEEYRWPFPTINYAYDESFLNYFGQRGIDEVEKAIAILNDLPTMSTVDLSQFPAFSQRVNYRARDLGLMDLKSIALKLVLEQLGLGYPGRFVFTLRGRDPQDTFTNYLVMMRNFDPETWSPTAYINGQLWTYNDIFDNQDSPTVKATTITEPVDPLILAEPVGSIQSGFSFSLFGFGSYVTGLTRDDVGGIRYIYRPDNKNVDTLPADSSGSASAGGGGSVGGGGGWIGWGVQPTNTVPPAGGGGTPTPTPTAVFFPQAIRSGSDKVTLTRGSAVYQPLGYGATNRYTETVVVVITNGVQRTISQRVTRVLAQPDILFSAADLADTDTSNALTDRNGVATNNDGINGGVTLDGPGQFSGTAILSFNKVGPVYFNTAPSFLGQPTTFGDFIWGSFDGSTNDPVVYPVGTSIQDVERAVFGGR